MNGSISKVTTSTGARRYRAHYKRTGLTGKQTRQSKTFETHKEASAWLAMQSLQGGGSTGKGTLAEYLGGWLEARVQSGAIRPNTAAGYRGKIETACRSIGHVKLTALTSEHLDAWLNDLRKAGLSKSTISQSRAIMHKALGDAVRRRLIAFNPVDGVETPKAPARPRPKVDNVEDALRFLAAMDATCDGPFFRLMAMTGMRRGEVGGLKWAAVDLDGGSLEVRETLLRESLGGKQRWIFGAPKSETSMRTIPLPDPAVALLRRRLIAVKEERLALGPDYNDLDLVFGDPFGNPVNLDAISARARRMRKTLGLPEGVQGVHGLRHLFGTMQNAGGTDIKTIQSLMGHSRASTTLDLYIKPDQDAAKAATDKTGDLFG